MWRPSSRILEVIRCEEPNDWEDAEPGDDDVVEGAAAAPGSLHVEPTQEGTWLSKHRSPEPLVRVAS